MAACQHGQLNIGTRAITFHYCGGVMCVHFSSKLARHLMTSIKPVCVALHGGVEKDPTVTDSDCDGRRF